MWNQNNHSLILTRLHIRHIYKFVEFRLLKKKKKSEMKKTRNLPENFRITNHNRIEGGYKSTKFWFSGTCLVVQKRFRVLQKCEQKQNQYWQMWNQSHEIIKPVSNLSIPCVDSRVQIPRIPAWKKEKMNQILNKMEWRILEKPCERNSGASSPRNNNPWN